MDFFVDFEGNLTDQNVKSAIRELNLVADRVVEVGTPQVPWFPTTIEDLD